MAKDKSVDPEKKEKKEKKDKKRKHSEAVAEDDTVEIVAEKRKHKDKKRKSTDASAIAVDADGDAVVVDAAPGAEIAVVKDEDNEDEDDKKAVAVKTETPLAALVPFANPLCDDKAQKKVLKSVKKAAKHKSLTRGVKETVKAIRKSPLSTPTTQHTPNGIVVLAADISPMDVISHIPVLCEDHGIPYVYVPSRAELGAAGSTKRPTSVVMVKPKAGGKGEQEGKEEWEGVYKDLHKLAVKLGQVVKV
ncbi:snoRNA-binding protein [Vermiconidia calcicola]|uniref:SnoRNA-binding protein n=1 Tax=Vermiconidia calcicola TaxID=1690605 RepID=A0ACC3NGX3_9PEZI|nr:snoRNA-binding protein [Vermiconidia calcicola]